MTNTFKKNFKGMTLVFAFLGLGMSIPGCPGGQMQTQLDAIQTSHQDMSKKFKTMEGQLAQLNNDMTQVKQLLPQMTNVIQAQKGAIDQLEATMKDLKSKGRKH